MGQTTKILAYGTTSTTDQPTRVVGLALVILLTLILLAGITLWVDPQLAHGATVMPPQVAQPTVENDDGWFIVHGDRAILVEELAGEETIDDPFAEEAAEAVNDPWEPFNSKMFTFNHNVDRYVFAPIAKGYDWIMPDPAEEAVSNFFRNVGFVPRMVNSLIQGKPKAAGTELGRFVMNSTVGLAGFFDVATGVGFTPPPAEDTGQTLATYGSDPGPYVVLPLLPPFTVRDGAGFVLDLAMDPVNYLLPIGPLFGGRSAERVNDRSGNLERYDAIEAGTLDLYSATRDAYTVARATAIAE